MSASNNEQAASGDSPSSQTASRIAHTPAAQALSSASDPSHCTCEWYVTKTEKTSHFATFPPELAERCIRAGTSERGACSQCGAPWVRVTDTKRRYIVSEGGSHADGTYRVRYSETPHDVSFAERGGDAFSMNKTRWHNDTTTTGWSPSCTCNADTVPCTILDPFSGAGTALLCADRLGRNAIGIDLSHAYVEMARERLRADCPLFAEISPPPAEDPEDARMADLFAEDEYQRLPPPAPKLDGFRHNKGAYINQRGPISNGLPEAAE